MINDLKAGKSIALVSDAGMPGICDPGEELVKSARLRDKCYLYPWTLCCNYGTCIKWSSILKIYI